MNDLSTTQKAGVAAILVLCLVVAVQGWFLLQLLRLEVVESSFGEEEGIARRAPAADFTLQSVSGQTVNLAGLIAMGRPVLLVFTSSRCGPCAALFPDIGRWQRDDGSALTVAVLVVGDAAANQAKAAKDRVARVLIDDRGVVARACRAQATPSAVLVGTEGRLKSVVAVGADQFRGLAVRAVDSARPAVTPPPEIHKHGNGAGALLGVGVEPHPPVPQGAVDERQI